MQQIQLPQQLAELLSSEHEIEAIVSRSLSSFEPVLRVNSCTFFPEYTDHGLDHVQSTITTAWQIAAEESRRHMKPIDVACLVCSVLLHDAGMHLGREGFVRLATGRSCLNHVKWFQSRFSELSWSETWSDFRQEASRFSGRDNVRLFGSPEVVRPPIVDVGSAPADWSESQVRLIGEFLRRHHGRLAHEIAVDGFPGTEREVPLLDPSAPDWFCDMVGLLARSHSIDLRVAVDYLQESPLHFNDAHEPHYVHTPFIMCLLRIADYLQLQADRAPAQQLQFVQVLRSPLSKREWAVHTAVEQIGLSGVDAEAIEIRARPKTVDVYLRLKSGLRALQDELDKCWAVLGEVYSRRAEFNVLGLTLRRVRSNLDNETSFASHAYYFPKHAAFGADADLLKVLVNPLYGDSPYVGVRELLQNAVDAVREREDLSGRRLPSPDRLTPNGDAKVQIEIQTDGEGPPILRVRDYGVGMTADTICRYFLRAGASFRMSDTWRRQHANPDGASRVVRSGRFGVGVLAAFLLGSRVTVRTRHISQQKGCKFSADIDTDPIQIEYFDDVDFSPGTEVTVALDQDVANRLAHNHEGWDWYVLANPTVRRIVNGAELRQHLRLPDETSRGDATWWRVDSPGYGPVFWSFEKSPGIACNGIHVLSERGKLYTHRCVKLEHPILEVSPPSLSIFDPDGRLPITLLRNQLAGDPSFKHDVFRSMWCYFIAALARKIQDWHLSEARGQLGSPKVGEFWSETPQIAASGFLSPWCLCGHGVIPVDEEVIRRGRPQRVLFGPLQLSACLWDAAVAPGCIVLWIDTNVSADYQEWASDLASGRLYGSSRVDSVPFLPAYALKLIRISDQRIITHGPADRPEEFRVAPSDVHRHWDAFTKGKPYPKPEVVRYVGHSWIGEMLVKPSPSGANTSVVSTIWRELIDAPVPTDPDGFRRWIDAANEPMTSALSRVFEKGA